MNRAFSPGSERRSPAESEMGCRRGIKRANSASRSPVSILLVNISFITITSEISGSCECYSSPDVHAGHAESFRATSLSRNWILPAHDAPLRDQLIIFHRELLRDWIYADCLLPELFAIRLATATTRSLGATGFAMWIS